MLAGTRPPQWGAGARGGARVRASNCRRNASFACGAHLALSARVTLASIPLETAPGERLLPLYPRREIRRRVPQGRLRLRRGSRPRPRAPRHDRLRRPVELRRRHGIEGSRRADEGTVRAHRRPGRPRHRGSARYGRDTGGAPQRLVPARDVRADYVGFTDVRGFVAGYGIDYAERYRALSDLVTGEHPWSGRPS